MYMHNSYFLHWVTLMIFLGLLRLAKQKQKRFNKRNRIYNYVHVSMGYSGLFSRGVYFATFTKWKFPQRLHPQSNYVRYMYVGVVFLLILRKLILRIAAISKFAKYTPLENNPLYGIEWALCLSNGNYVQYLDYLINYACSTHQCIIQLSVCLRI